MSFVIGVAVVSAALGWLAHHGWGKKVEDKKKKLEEKKSAEEGVVQTKESVE